MDGQGGGPRQRVSPLRKGGGNDCRESRCNRDGPSIHFPFTLQHQPEHCGYPGFELSCNNAMTILTLLNSLKLLVEDIDYVSQEIRNTETLDYLPLVEGCKKIDEIPSVSSGLEYGHPIIGWLNPICGYCEDHGMDCGFKNYTKQLTIIHCFDKPWSTKGSLKEPLIAGGVLGILLFGIILMALYEFYRSNKIERENQARVEKFLEDYRALRPTRYTYAEDKHIRLWCVQWNATDRPSIKVVTQMLEGDGSNLTVPPPFTARSTTHVDT
ncbi:hypothetical protein RND71_040593 [Anisodus tanguticus]|uniref:RING-type E3 ubiquitin transferase n=1 Tax=Anisodus tanguticus TaxID=243964 RepID=A0AAE1UTH7_9SOLA|nr:hypothetical protein RND71_040593 [Anisodus tanguticus]